MHQHRAPGFWQNYNALSEDLRKRADRQFSMLKTAPQHPSLQFKKIGTRQGRDIWSARVTLNYRALAVAQEDGFLWFWIGDHKTYDALIK